MTTLPMKNLLLSSCIVIAINGCAAKVDLTPVVEVPSEKITGHQVSKCKATQRDLTIPWSLRQYWCGEEDRQDNLQDINDDVMNAKVINDLALNETYLDEINNEGNSSQYVEPKVETRNPASLKTPVLNREEILKRLKDDSKVDKRKAATDPVKKSIEVVASIDKPIASKLNNEPIPSDTIVFARNLRVLGPEGRAATHAMINKVSGSGQVLLRGLILPDEVLVDSNLYREQVSVGRALAVKKYWQEQGLDISHITILHHNPELTGRAVEVIFHG
jgi:hypothetical protein